MSDGIRLVRGKRANIAQLERHRQGVLVSGAFARIEIVTGQQDVAALGQPGVDAEIDDRIARIGIHDDAGVLIPAAGALDSLGVTGARHDLAAQNCKPQACQQ